MESTQRFKDLNDRSVSRKEIGEIIDLAKSENNCDVIYRLSKILNSDPYEAFFKFQIIDYPATGLNGKQHTGDYKEALDDCGRLRPGFKFQSGKVIKVQPKEKAKKQDVGPKKAPAEKTASRAKPKVAVADQPKPKTSVGSKAKTPEVKPKATAPAVIKKSVAKRKLFSKKSKPKTSKPKEKKESTQLKFALAQPEISIDPNLKDLGFVSAADVPDEPKDVFTLPGEIGKFLQKIQPHKALILIKGTKHTSKSQLAMQVANAFAENDMPVAYIDYEQGGMESKDTVDSINRNTTAKGRKLIAIKGFLENPFEELKSFCKHCQVIVADSVTDLGITADQLNELRVNFPKVIWVFISQVKENGEMYGGNKMAHNPTAIIKCHPAESPAERYATLEKNRGNDLDLKYNIFSKKLIANEPKTEVLPQAEKIEFSFNIK